MAEIFLLEEKFKKNDILEKKIGYHFKEKNLLVQALTHSSFINENGSSGLKDYERFEYLGDAVIGLIVSEFSFKKFDHYSEGGLSKLRSRLVSETNLAEIARTIDLGSFLLLGKGEELTNGRDKNSILANSLEALFGAVFLDGGYKKACSAFFRITKSMDITAKLSDDKDYKSKLQEILQEKIGKIPTYKVISESGPGHSKTFEVGVCLNRKILERGKGKSKKEAEQKAAKRVLKKIEKEDFHF